MKLTITQKHINHGIRHSPCECPIALALCDQLDVDVSNGERVSVDDDAVEVYDADNRLIREYQATKKLARFVKRFDKVGKSAVKPTTFQLKRVEK